MLIYKKSNDNLKQTYDMRKGARTIYRVGQFKQGQLTFLLVITECINKIK